MRPVYYLYRMLPNGAWKYTESFNSTLDPQYHDAINYFREEGIKWELRLADGTVRFNG